MTLHELVQQTAVLHSDRPAVCFDQCNDHLPVYFTYKTVVEVATELTGFLQTHCDPQETREIGLCCYPGIRLPSWILGILQVPAAYCPIDPDAPAVYSAYFMRKCNLKYVLVETSQVDKFQSSFATWWSQHTIPGGHLGLTLFKLHWNGVDVDLPTRDSKEECAEGKTRDAGSFPNGSGGGPGASMDARAPRCLAYVLHTSGTTGVPKIVRVPHCCITPNIQHFRAIFQVRPGDVLFMASPLTFDPSVVDLFVALTSGASLLIIPDAVKVVPSQLAAALFHRHRVTVLQATPTLLRRFGAQLLKSTVLSSGSPLRVLALGGEPFPSLATFRSWRAEGNGTQVFNVYGITEVSSWATCYRIPAADLDPSLSSESPVPLGAPLLGTIIEVRDQDGCLVEDGDGQVFIGGEERVCFLDDETTVPLGTMRGTGDLVTVKGKDMFFLGRKDSQIKRHGKRLNLEGVQQAAERLCGAEACAVTWGPREGLLLFVVPSDGLTKEQLLGQLERHLPSHAVPDDLVFVEALPFTSHGKIDRPALTKMYWSHRKLNRACRLRGEEQLWERLQDLWTSVLSPGGDPRGVPKDALFLSSGGDSFKCLRFLEEVEGLVGTAVPGLLEVILSCPISEIHSHVLRAVFPSAKGMRKRRRGEHLGPEAGDADPGPEPGRPGDTDPEPAAFAAVSRGSQGPELSAPSRGPAGQRAGPGALTLRVRWRSDTGRCVDASPLVVVATAPGTAPSATVYVGSHSGRLQALDLGSGRLKWERVLGDRIESSACLSRCGRFVAVGCYDGFVYALRSATGETHWRFATRDAVKSSAAQDPSTGLFYVGSHDQHVYALDLYERKRVWELHCGGGAVFASPCLSLAPYCLYVATLGGLLVAINPASGHGVWKHSCGKPLFSSPRCCPPGVCVGCVDGNLYCFNHAGEQVWQLSTGGPIFSSPCVWAADERNLFLGSHDGCVYCCDPEGRQRWKFTASAPVYATPFAFRSPRPPGETLVAAASTDGWLWVLDAQSGRARATAELPGQVFSSPVVWDALLVIGCRDDGVYGLELVPAS
ncbi:beta-alanine-activating enzyme [Tachyglossus aculeatus]|uniref:beta-alanine-activating enzyme n=1 Tax=Tachyglossus aculeatus TaxID=9261 RepID=UPI0018F5E8BF|nr:beta-alanine-activating enzyme [Tachyglossus aculeatus]